MKNLRLWLYQRLLWSLALLAVATAASAAELEVVRVEGQVLAWRPFESAWLSLQKGDRLPFGTLIQTPGKATLVCKKLGLQRGRADDNSLTLEIEDAMMMRVYERLNRNVVLSNFSMPQKKTSFPIGTGLQKAAPKGKELPFAWRRINSMGGLLAELPEAVAALFTPKSEPKSMTIERSGELHLKLPVEGSVFMIDDFPTELPLSWDLDPVATLRVPVDVYVRKVRDGSQKPLFTTRSQQTSFKIWEPGTYYIKVAAPELGLESSDTMITIEDLR